MKKPARVASPKTPSTLIDSEATWAWDLIADVVAELPCGAVTAIVLTDDDPVRSHAATVGDLMATLLDGQRPFAHVSVGDPKSGMAEVFADAVNEEQNDGQVAAYVDRDYKVMARLGDGGGCVYPCGIPSLDNVERFLAADDRGHERLVILDGFERARPYRAVGASLVPDGLPLSVEDVDAWRSADLRAFAASRPDVPTVVVWHSADVERDGAKRSIGDAADLLLLHKMGDEHGWLSVNVRSEHGCWEAHALSRP